MFAKVFQESSELMGFDKDYSEKLVEASKDFTKEHLVWTVEFISKNASRIKYSQNPQIVLDTVLFKLCQKFVSYDDILKMAQAGASAPSSASPDEPAEKTSPEEVNAETSAPAEKSSTEGSKPEKSKEEESPDKSEEVSEEEDEPAFEDPDVAPSKEKSGWDKVKDIIKKERPSLFFKLDGSQATINSKEKVVTVMYSNLLNITGLEEDMIREKIKEVASGDFRVVIEKVKKKSKKNLGEKNKEAPKKRMSPSEIEDQVPVVESIIDEFGGKIERN
jgi:DNA polymerase III gamma/tau subunit